MIHLYILTYNNNPILNEWALKSLHESDYDRDRVKLFVINNHSNIVIEEQYKQTVTVLNNVLRPDFSIGHLSRNWNQAIMRGFVNLNNPQCEYVITCHNDTIFKKDWYNNLMKHARIYNYIQLGAGDQFQMFSPAAVKHIGMNDERFCGNGVQEGDYLLRARLYFGMHSTINDYNHDRIHNPIEENDVIETTPLGWQHSKDIHTLYVRFHPICYTIFKKKWEISPIEWSRYDVPFDSLEPLIDNYILYPYFEKDIITLKQQKYVCEDTSLDEICKLRTR